MVRCLWDEATGRNSDAVALEAAKEAVFMAKLAYAQTGTLADYAVMCAADHSLVVVEHAIYLKGLGA